MFLVEKVLSNISYKNILSEFNLKLAIINIPAGREFQFLFCKVNTTRSTCQQDLDLLIICCSLYNNICFSSLEQVLLS